MEKVFISYSHKDEKWKDRLVTHLKAFVHQGDIVLWDDRKIDTGQDWFPEIEAAMAEADIAICMISKHYLASDFINKEEIPELKKHRKEEGMLLMPLLLSPCTWEAIKWLKGIQMFPRDGVSLEEIKPKVKQEKKLTEFALEIHERIEAKDFATPVTAPTSAAPEKLDIDRLPETGVQLFGRKKELQLLDEMWATGSSNIISFVAWGGVGKSTLVNQWLDYMKAENYSGAKKVFGWSFYSQGTSERVTSADKFISEALEWFGDKNPKKGSPWDKGQRLADLVRKKKTLLILDGLEPLQSGYDYEKGKIKDPALSILVTQLARNNNGLCLITTREKVVELELLDKDVMQLNLEQISKEAGRALLRVGRVQGTDCELEAASEEFGNHALAINLLGSYLHGIKGHNVSNTKNIPDLDIPKEQGRHPRRVIAAFEKRFGEGPKTQALRLMGLFDRPAHVNAVKAVRKGPRISGLTDKLNEMTERKWLNLLDELRECKLLAHKSKHNPDIIDCHPLIREYFGEKLQIDKAEAWKEANRRLYEYYKGVPENEYPNTIEEMELLFASVTHGCLAGQHQETFDDVYRKRITRGGEYYNIRKLGEFGADLAAVSCFFEKAWSKPASSLSDQNKAVALAIAGFTLRALGRLSEATEPMEAGMKALIDENDWSGAAIGAGNLSELSLILGNIRDSVDYAQQRVEFARRGKHTGNELKGLGLEGNTLHQAGELTNAKGLFEKAEEMQKKEQPEEPYLYSLGGFLFCDLLLSQGQYKEVQKRAGQTLELAKQYLGKGLGLWDIGFSWLSIGRAYMLEAVSESGGQTTDDSGWKTELMKAEDFINKAVDCLREAGGQDFIVLGLLARAELYRYKRSWEKASVDLEEAKEISERGEMNLYLADYHLEAARLCLAQGKNPEAHDNYEEAAKRVENMGYHRRNPEVLLIQAELEIVEDDKKNARETLKKAKKRIDEMGCHRWDSEVERLKELLKKATKTK